MNLKEIKKKSRKWDFSDCCTAPVKDTMTPECSICHSFCESISFYCIPEVTIDYLIRLAEIGKSYQDCVENHSSYGTDKVIVKKHIKDGNELTEKDIKKGIDDCIENRLSSGVCIDCGAGVEARHPEVGSTIRCGDCACIERAIKSGCSVMVNDPKVWERRDNMSKKRG